MKITESGFPGKNLEHAFEPYVTTKPSGTGLGLPMIKKITEEHGGTIGVENILGEDGRISGAAVVIIFRMLSRNSGKKRQFVRICLDSMFREKHSYGRSTCRR